MTRSAPRPFGQDRPPGTLWASAYLPDLTAYLDGQNIGTQQFSNQLDSLNSTLQVGANYGGGAPINGAMDDIAIYPLALSAAQVAAHYHAAGY